MGAGGVDRSARPALARGPGGARKGAIGLGALVAATYFMVSGGPYGLEELVQSAGFAGW